MNYKKYILIYLSTLLFACSNEFDIDQERIINADQEPENWLAHATTYDEQRISHLKQIKETLDYL